MKPYYEDDQTTLYLGDALEVLRTLPDTSVDCCVTSPPYFGLRDYGVAGQIGAEASPAEFVAALVAVFTEVRRVLSDDGTLWLNLGDSYYSGRGAATGKDDKNSARRFGVRAVDKGGQDWGTPKGLLGIPHRSVFALQDDGWIWRNTNIWSKPNPMPEAVKDRPTSSHEYVFLLAKSRRYYYDADAIAETATGQASGNGFARPESINKGGPGKDEPREGRPQLFLTGGTRNRRDVWTIPTEGFPEAHFATFPLLLPSMCIAAGCKPGGVVLDPFSGSGTTGLAASQLGRKYVGIDLNRDYLDLSLRTRLAQPSLTAEGIA